MTQKVVDDINFEDIDQKTEKESITAKFKSFKIENLIDNYKLPILFALIGLVLAGIGVFLYKNTNYFEGDKIEVISLPSEEKVQSSKIIVEISGSVTNPGVYSLENGSRIDDLLISSGGLSAVADREWVEKNINRASKLNDGQKLYIKSISEQTTTSTAKNDMVYQTVSPAIGIVSQTLVNINTSSFDELDKLPGIGQVYGQKIIEQRPYSTSEELLSRKILPKSTFEKIKDLITVY